MESLVNRHPKVLMSAGVAVPDPVLGEVGWLYVIPRPGSVLTEAEVRAWCSEHLADYKVPRRVVLRDTLPMTPAGKVHKAALRDELAASSAAAPDRVAVSGAQRAGSAAAPARTPVKAAG